MPQMSLYCRGLLTKRYRRMKLTQEVINQIQEAMNHTKKNGDINWEDNDEIQVQLAGTFAADRFIVIKNVTKSSTSLQNFKGK